MDRDEDSDLCALRDYVEAMVNNGYDALELEAFSKKFKTMDYERLLSKLGCTIVEDIVLLNLNNDVMDDEYDDFYWYYRRHT